MRAVPRAILAIVSVGVLAAGRPARADRVQVVDMMPRPFSGERYQDSEPSIAVNPSNPAEVAGTAFTHDFSCAHEKPIYVSSDGGESWDLNCVLPSREPPGGGLGDLMVRFGTRGGLYAAWAPGFHLKVLRADTAAAPGPMTTILDHADQTLDMPHIDVATVGGHDRVSVGSSKPYTFSSSATVDRAPAGEAAAPSFLQTTIEEYALPDSGEVPVAVHPGGTTYAAFARLYSLPGGRTRLMDVVVARDDPRADAPFRGLLDPDGRIGSLVVRERNVPFASADGEGPFGQQRVYGSSIAIAVDRHDPPTVYLAWGDAQPGSVQTLHVRRSTNGGRSWSADDLFAVRNATNAALAINTNGTVGFLYQQLMGPTDGDPSTWRTQRWVTRLDRTNDAFAHVQRLVLVDFPAREVWRQGDPYLGDFLTMVAAGPTFYGPFSADNRPLRERFPSGVSYVRNVDLDAGTLLDLDGRPVGESIDPFFVKVEEVSLDPCATNPGICIDPAAMEKGLLGLLCLDRPCIVRDPLPQNCLVKFDCPGCAKTQLCPPFYHLFLEGLDPAWNVGLFDGSGARVPYEETRTPTGIVLSFQPSPELYLDGKIGDYVLGFELGPQGKVGVRYDVRTRLESSDRPYGTQP